MSDKEIRFKVVPREDDPTRGALLIECDRHHTGQCQQNLWSKPATGCMWQWDGNVEKPTISPSVDCQGGCGRHFTITNGKVV